MPLPQLGSEPGQGLADHARHVIRHTLDPSFLELYFSPDDMAGGVIHPPSDSSLHPFLFFLSVYIYIYALVQDGLWEGHTP